jgi:hypothetical protein
MRTTLTIDDDLLQAARSLSRERSESIGKVISDLARRGLYSIRSVYEKSSPDDLPAFHVREDSPPITPEQIKAAEDEL